MADEPEVRDEELETTESEPEAEAPAIETDDEAEHTSFSDRFRFTHAPLEEDRAQRWMRLGLQILVGIIIILLLLLAGRYIHHRYFVKHNNSGSTTASSGSSAPGKLPASNSSNGSGNSGSNGSSANGSSSHTSTSGTTAGKGAVGKGGQLANTGPGDTIAIFLGATLLATGGHYLVSARRQANR